MKAIEINGLSKTFRDKRFRSVQALSDLSLEIEFGEVFGFLGPNGAGKSTTIKCLLGLIRPTSGQVLIAGKPSHNPESRCRVGYLPENPAFYDFLNAIEYLKFTGRAHGMAGNLLHDRIDEVLHKLEIWDARKRAIRTYSKGMVQRLGLAQTLLHDPDIFILDEPMSGLDPLGRALVKAIILDLKSRGKTVFFSTHISPDVEKVCDRVGIINKGRFQSVERVDAILREGLEGYQVTTSETKSGLMEERFVEKERLGDFLATASQNGLKVQLVEPHRKHLEEFFLSIIRSSGAN